MCSECGWGDFDEPSHLLTTAKFIDNDRGPNYCPNCGREVVRETSGRDTTCVFDDYTAKVMAELVQVMEERDTLLSKFKLSQEMRRGEHEQYSKENAKLREQLDWERSENEWMREFDDRMAEHCGTKDCPSLVAYVNKIETENAKLRELTKDMFNCIRYANEQDWFYFERDKCGCGVSCVVNGEECGLMVLADRMRKLGIEVDNDD